MEQYSIVIVSYNCKNEIQLCIESLRQCYSSADVQIIVVDNASSDDTPAYLSSLSGIEVILNEENVGFAKGCNLGAERAHCELLLFLNPDTQVTKGSLEAMSKPLLQTRQVGAVGPLSNFAAGWQNLRYVFNQETMGDANLASQKDVVAAELNKTLRGQAKETRLLIGFCLMMRRELFFDIGKMDEELILGMDDLDLSWRLKLLGKQLIVVFDAFVFHQGQVSFKAQASEKVDAMKEYSRVAFSRKLIEHYGHRSEVPSAWDLWEVDWFELEDQEIIEEQSKSNEPVGERKEQAMGISFCVLATAQQTSRKDVENSIDNLLELGVSSDDIIVINGTSLSMSQSFIGKEVFEWNVSVDTAWDDVIRRARKWFSAESILCLEGGITIPHFHFRKLSELVVQKRSCCGTLLNIEEGKVGQSTHRHFSMKNLMSDERPPYFLLDGSVTTECELEFKEELLLHKSSALDTRLTQETTEEPQQAQQPKSTQTMIPDGLPAQIEVLVQENPNVCFWGRGQSLDIRGKEKNPHSAALIVYRVSVSDIRGLSYVMQQHKHDRLKKIAVIITNAMYQSEGDKPYATVGVQPVDVLREMQLAGYVIGPLDPYECEPQEIKATYHKVSAQTETFTREEALYATAEKILIEATPCSAEYDLSKKVSIIMLALNKVEYTRQCIESIQKYTRQEYELILINNGSTDGTRSYFDSIPGAIVIHNEENRGVAAGWNQGLDRASGEYVLIFNNDTIVGEGSIENLVRAAMNHPYAGIVVPRSNAIAGPQMVEGFTFSAPEEIPAKISVFQKEHELSAWEFTRVKGFCMLISKETVAETGYFDEQFGFGNFEDDDYSCRVLYAGKKLLVADDSFIFHYGSVSFGQADCDWNELMIRNQKLFNEKWRAGRAALTRQQSALPGIPAITQSLVPPENKTKVTGVSSQIEKKSLAWQEYLNGNLEQANTLFLNDLSFRTDDISIYYGLGSIALDQNRVMDAYTFFCRGLEVNSDSAELSEAVVKFLRENATMSDIIKVVDVLVAKYPQNGPLKALQKECSAEEMSTLESTWLETVQTLVGAGEYVKATAILYKKKDAGEENFEVYNMLGIIAYYQQIYDEAFKFFEKALQYNSTDEDALMNLYDAGVRLKLWDRVIQILEYALAMKPDMEDLRRCYEEALNARGNHIHPDDLIQYREMNIGAETLIREGMLDKAIAAVDEILNRDPQNFRALNNKGLLFWYQQSREEAWGYFKRSLDSNIWYTDALLNMYDCALLIDKRDEFTGYLNRALDVAPTNKELLAIKSELQQSSLPSRLNIYFDNDQDTATQQKIIQANQLVDAKEYEPAVLLFTEVLEHNPDNIDCYNGLGIIAYYWGNYQDAFKLISRAVELKPLDQDSLLNLWDVAHKVGREAEVREVLQTAVALDPSLLQVAESLQAF